jgi:hypothetical protein
LTSPSRHASAAVDPSRPPLLHGQAGDDGEPAHRVFLVGTCWNVGSGSCGRRAPAHVAEAGQLRIALGQRRPEPSRRSAFSAVVAPVLPPSVPPCLYRWVTEDVDLCRRDLPAGAPHLAPLTRVRRQKHSAEAHPWLLPSPTTPVRLATGRRPSTGRRWASSLYSCAGRETGHPRSPPSCRTIGQGQVALRDKSAAAVFSPGVAEERRVGVNDRLIVPRE